MFCGVTIVVIGSSCLLFSVSSIYLHLSIISMFQGRPEQVERYNKRYVNIWVWYTNFKISTQLTWRWKFNTPTIPAIGWMLLRSLQFPFLYVYSLPSRITELENTVACLKKTIEEKDAELSRAACNAAQLASAREEVIIGFYSFSIMLRNSC